MPMILFYFSGVNRIFVVIASITVGRFKRV